MGFDPLYQNGSLSIIDHIKDLLHHIVGVRIFHHDKQTIILGEDLIKDQRTVLARTILYTLLHYIACELVLTHRQYLPTHFRDNHLLILRSTPFQYMLNNIVSVLVLHQTGRTPEQLIKNGFLHGCDKVSSLQTCQKKRG